MLKVHILATCSHCNGKAYLPMGEDEDCQGQKYTRHCPPACYSTISKGFKRCNKFWFFRLESNWISPSMDASHISLAEQ